MLRATNLKAVDSGSSDPYLKLSVGKEKQQTGHKARELNPQWNESFVFNASSSTSSHQHHQHHRHHASATLLTPPLQVSAPTAAWRSRRQDKWADFQAYAGGGLRRYDDTLTKAFWKSAVPGHAVGGKDLGQAAARWGNVSGAVVHLYQSGYWGSWQFELVRYMIEPPSGAVSHRCIVRPHVVTGTCLAGWRRRRARTATGVTRRALGRCRWPVVTRQLALRCTDATQRRGGL